MLASSHCLAKTFADSNLPSIICWGVVKGCHINPTWIAASGGNNIIVWLLTPSLYLILKGMLWLYYPHILPSSPLSVFQLHQFESVWGVNCWVCQMWSLLCRIKHYRLFLGQRQKSDAKCPNVVTVSFIAESIPSMKIYLSLKLCLFPHFSR